MGDTQCRKWFITINNPLDHDMSHEQIIDCLSKIKKLDYWCMSDEIGGQEHTYHTHLYIYRSGQIRFSALKRLFPTANLKMAKGSSQECRDYIRKEGKYKDSEKACTNLKDTFQEYGELPNEKQGSRTDLNTLYDMIKDGLSDYEILEENPNYMKRLSTIGQVRETLKYEEFRNKLRSEMHVEYWSGSSGTGKTSGIYAMYGFDNVYRVTDYKNPWDSYKGQDVVVFEEFRSDVEITKLLIWLDIYPLELPCRYNNKTACYTKVFFTSNVPLYCQYKYIQSDEPETFKALKRRIHKVKLFNEDGTTELYDTEVYMSLEKDPFVKLTPAEQNYIQTTLGFG